MSETELDFLEDMDELVSAEDFLEYFSIEYEPSVVHVNRLHILQRFHNYLEEFDQMPESENELRIVYASLLLRAYTDFVESDAKTEKVFRVFKSMEPSEIMVPLTDLMPGASACASKV